MIWVSSDKDYQQILEKKNNDSLIILFKHSTRCPVSSRALQGDKKQRSAKEASLGVPYYSSKLAETL